MNIKLHRDKPIEVNPIKNAENLKKLIELHEKDVHDWLYDCVINKNRIKYLVDNSLMLVTALSPKIGYDNAAKIAKNALKNKTTLKIEAMKSGLINEREYDKIVDPKKMIKPD